MFYRKLADIVIVTYNNIIQGCVSIGNYRIAENLDRGLKFVKFIVEDAYVYIKLNSVNFNICVYYIVPILIFVYTI